MSLIGTARALDDDRFKWRVRAALLTTAAQKRSSAKPIEIAFSANILQAPMRANNQLEALCATDPEVLKHVTVDEGNFVNTEAVPDTALQAVADSNFTWMARAFDDDQKNGAPTDTGVYAVGGTATGF